MIRTEQRDCWADRPSLDSLVATDIWTLRREFLERLWPDVRGLRVVEVGSGPAHDSLTFAERGARVTALDASLTALAMARRLYSTRGLTIDLVRGDAEALPFGASQFDLAFSAGVLEHFEDGPLRGVLAEMCRVVQPGGHVLAFCPNRHNIFYQSYLRRNIGRYEFERAFSASQLARRFASAGLEDVRASGVHVHPAPNYLLPAWLPKHHRIEPLCRACFRWLEQWDRPAGLKSLIGQDCVVWGRVPVTSGPRPARTEAAARNACT